MNILDQSFDIALSLLPKAKEDRNTKNKFFHFAFGYKRNKLLAIGQNSPEKTHTRALVLAKRFNTDLEYPHFHAETDLISRLWGKHYIDNSLKMVVVRLNKRGELRCSQPCDRCNMVIQSLGISKIWWSLDNGFSE
jgi:hypothetical protein